MVESREPLLEALKRRLYFSARRPIVDMQLPLALRQGGGGQPED